jgi:hypothetical protein
VILLAASGCQPAIPPNPGRLEPPRPPPSSGDGQPADPYTEDEERISKGRLGGVWINCYKAFSLREGPRRDLDRLVAACGEPTGMTTATAVRTGALDQAGTAARHTFTATPGKCYRVYSTAAPTLTDLDIALLDPGGKLVILDRTRDPMPVVPGRGPFCPEQAGVYTVELSAVTGRGEYAVVVMHD